MACGAQRKKRPADEPTLEDGPFSTEDVLRVELAHVLGDKSLGDNKSWSDKSCSLDALWPQLHAQPDDQRPNALCLSGGGIRSATFCLGVLQWLAQHERLKDYHYLSTVSGGGYIGSWLVNGLVQAAKHAPAASADAWSKRVGQSSGSVGGAACAGAARSAGDAKDPVAPLRAFSNYLSPRGGMSGDAFSLAAIFIRNLLLNALVWLSVLAVLVAAPRLYIALLGASEAAQALPYAAWAFFGVAFAVVVWGVSYIAADLPQQDDGQTMPTAPSPAQQQALAAAGAGAATPRNGFVCYCFAPIVAAAVVLSIGGAWLATLRETHWGYFAAAGAFAHGLGVLVGIPRRTWRGLPKRHSNAGGVFVVVLVGAVGGVLASLALSQLGAAPVAAEDAGNQRLLYATFAVPAMTGAFWLAMALYAGLMGRKTDEFDREWWARATAYWLRFSLIWLLAFGLVVWLPLPLLDRLGAIGPTALQFGAGGGVLGVLTSVIGYWSANGAELQRKAKSVLRALRVKLLDAMAIVVVLATLLALSLAWSTLLDRCHGWAWTQRLCTADLHAQTEFLREQQRLRAEYEHAAEGAADAPARAAALVGVVEDSAPGTGLSASAQAYRHVLLEGDGKMLLVATVVLLVLSIGLALLMGVNVFSLHGMYGNRLVRAYLGSGRAQRRPHWFTGFDPADNPPLAQFTQPLCAADGRPRLYPVITIALNVVKVQPDQLDWQQRKAAPFVATPRHCGAAAVGFRPTERYLGGMSLGRAMTISGAAASPNMGYHSSAPVTFVMALFNVRLGWWAANPGPKGASCWSKKQPLAGLGVALAEATGRTGTDGRFVYLSDGGHFDNLGIYEMVRRRCRRIVAVDATCDGRFQWSDLLDVVRKVRVDLGIPILLPPVLPGRDGSALRHVEAPIRYSARDGNAEADDGELIVLKPRLLPLQDPPELGAYAQASAPEGSAADDPRRFPHQSTADQFYDEQQFESYRLLGYTTAEAVLSKHTPSATKQADASAACTAPTLALAAPAGATAAGTDAKAPQHKDSARADTAGAGGLAGLLGQLGTAGALAGALTIGVVGTVALAPTELRLSDTDRALLEKGLNLRMDAGALKLNDADRALLNGGIRVSADGSALIDPAKHLSDAAEQLFAATKRFEELKFPPLQAQPISVTLDPALVNQIADLRTQVVQLSLRIRVSAPGSAVQPDDPGLTGTVTRLQTTLAEIEKKLPVDPALTAALKSLQTAVENIAPRRNVRGQDGGTR